MLRGTCRGIRSLITQFRTLSSKILKSLPNPDRRTKVYHASLVSDADDSLKPEEEETWSFFKILKKVFCSAQLSSELHRLRNAVFQAGSSIYAKGTHRDVT